MYLLKFINLNTTLQINYVRTYIEITKKEIIPLHNLLMSVFCNGNFLSISTLLVYKIRWCCSKLLLTRHRVLRILDTLLLYKQNRPCQCSYLWFRFQCRDTLYCNFARVKRENESSPPRRFFLFFFEAHQKVLKVKPCSFLVKR